MLLSTIIFLPTVGALILALGFNKRDEEPMRVFSLVVTVATFIFTLFLFKDFRYDVAGIQPVTEGGISVKIRGSPPGTSTIMLGYDGVSFPLVMLTAFISMLAMRPVGRSQARESLLILFLLLETGMLGVFWRSISSCFTSSGK